MSSSARAFNCSASSHGSSELGDDDLRRLSKDRVLSLDLTEMQAIQAHFAAEGRPPSDAELETLAQTWSEHCVHKTFRARITLTHTSSDGEVTVSFHDGLLPALREVTEELDPPWLRSAFVDDAGTPGGGWGYPPGYAPYSRLDPVTGRDWP